MPLTHHAMCFEHWIYPKGTRAMGNVFGEWFELGVTKTSPLGPPGLEDDSNPPSTPP